MCSTDFPFITFVLFIALNDTSISWSFQKCFSALCPDARGENDLSATYWCIWRNGDGFCVKINQLPKIAWSSPLLPLPPLPFLISTTQCCHAQIPDRLPPPFFFPHLPSSHFNTSTSWGPRSSIDTAVPSCSLAHPALIYCPLFPWSPISSSFLPTTPRFSYPPVPLLSIAPSIRLSNGHRGRESPCSCLGQTLITHTVTSGWGHSHPFCTWPRPAHSTLHFLG